MNSKIEIRVSVPIENADIDALMSASWPNHSNLNWSAILDRSLAYVSAHSGDQVVGFVNIAWDGGVHAFILDTIVHPDFRRQGLGKSLVEQAKSVANQKSIEWLHVDFEPKYREFYHKCGFRPTEAGLIKLTTS